MKKAPMPMKRLAEVKESRNMIIKKKTEVYCIRPETSTASNPARASFMERKRGVHSLAGWQVSRQADLLAGSSNGVKSREL